MIDSRTDQATLGSSDEPDPDRPSGVQRAGIEQRQHERVPVEVDVDFASESNFYRGFSENISQGGVFVVTWEPKRIGEKVRLKFRLPDAEDVIDCQGEVRWLRIANPDTPDVSPGLGIRFIDMPPAYQRRVEEFVHEREPLFYDDE